MIFKRVYYLTAFAACQVVTIGVTCFQLYAINMTLQVLQNEQEDPTGIASMLALMLPLLISVIAFQVLLFPLMMYFCRKLYLELKPKLFMHISHSPVKIGKPSSPSSYFSSAPPLTPFRFPPSHPPFLHRTWIPFSLLLRLHDFFAPPRTTGLRHRTLHPPLSNHLAILEYYYHHQHLRDYWLHSFPSPCRPTRKSILFFYFFTYLFIFFQLWTTPPPHSSRTNSSSRRKANSLYQCACCGKLSCWLMVFTPWSYCGRPLPPTHRPCTSAPITS